MGLLDYLSGSYGGGGLLSNLYPSSLLQPQDQPQTQYDPMGNPIFMPQSDKPSPFGLPPGFNAADYAPKSPFNAGAAAAPFTAPSFAAGPTIAPPQAAPQQSQPAPQGVDFPQNQIPVGGGYQMPRVGDMANFTPPQTSTDISAQSRQPQMMQQGQPQALPPALANQGGFGAGLRGLVNNLHTGPLGAIAGGIGNAMGAESPEQQNARSQYKALVGMGMDPNRAMLAVMNPDLYNKVVQPKTYGFQKLDSDTVLRTDPTTGKVEVAYGGGEDRGTITGPDGKPIAIPPGVDRKTFVNEVSRANAKAAAGEKTEVQAKAEIFANKMEYSNKEIQDGVGTSLAGKIASGVPLGNYVQSPEYQKYKQASSNFITALLRQESGAAISKSEFERYEKEYMPQPGDGPEVLAQKSEARRVAIEGMKKGAGPGYKSPTSSPLPAGWSVKVN
jgi:hypothetical protein